MTGVWSVWNIGGNEMCRVVFNEYGKRVRHVQAPVSASMSQFNTAMYGCDMKSFDEPGAAAAGAGAGSPAGVSAPVSVCDSVISDCDMSSCRCAKDTAAEKASTRSATGSLFSWPAKRTSRSGRFSRIEERPLRKFRRQLAAAFSCGVIALMSVSGTFAPLPAHATGVPVFDGAAVTQMITELMQLMKEFEQLEREYSLLSDTRGDMVFRFEQAFKQFDDTMRGTSEFAHKYVTNDYDDAQEAILRDPNGTVSASTLDTWLADVRDNGGSGLPHAIKEIYRINKMGDRCDRLSGYIKHNCQRRAALRAVKLFSYSTGEQTALKRRTELKNMRDSIKDTDSQKQIADLQTRIAQEQMAIANEKQRLAMMEAKFKEEEALLEDLHRQERNNMYLSE